MDNYSSEKGHSPANRRTVLVVDDNLINRQILVKLLSNEYRCLEAEDGAGALEILLNSETKIYAVILDIMMPVMDGYAFLKEKAANSSLENIPVIAMTGSDDDGSEIKALAAGAWDFVAKPYKPEIIRFRLKNVIERSELAAFEKLKYLAEYDSLTGIFNKARFFDEAHEQIMNSTECCVFCRFDINRFNLINSFYGMAEGDKLLRYIADKLRNFSYMTDSFTYGRIESDVFGCCFPYRNSEQLINLVRAAKNELRAYNENFDIVPTFGICIVEDKNVPPEKLYARANLAAKRCKGNYMNSYAIYNSEMERSIEVEQEITNEMTFALQNHDFLVYLQPKYTLGEERCAGAEALVRWFHPEKGLISPGKFIPVFERNGFIMRLDYYMWESVCRLIKEWLDEGITPHPVSVNVSRVNLYNPHLVDTICELVRRYDVPPELLNLEITESACTDNPAVMKRTIDLLHENGFIIMMDDFGSGYSSLNVLKDMNVDVLKIDMKFLDYAEDDERGRCILTSVIKLAEGLGIPTIAEGVERRDQCDFLRGRGCNYAQGFYYAKPMPVEQYRELMAQ